MFSFPTKWMAEPERQSHDQMIYLKKQMFPLMSKELGEFIWPNFSWQEKFNRCWRKFWSFGGSTWLTRSTETHRCSVGLQLWLSLSCWRNHFKIIQPLWEIVLSCIWGYKVIPFHHSNVTADCVTHQTMQDWIVQFILLARVNVVTVSCSWLTQLASIVPWG